MPGNTTNTTNGTEAGGAAPPMSGGGGFPGSRGIDTAREKIQGVIEGLSGQATNALEGLQAALDNLGVGIGHIVSAHGQPAAEAVIHLW